MITTAPNANQQTLYNRRVLPAFSKAPRITHDEVHGYAGAMQGAQPDRVFHILQKGKMFDLIWEIDGYSIKDEVNNKMLWTLHLICPTCDRPLKLDSEKKAIHISEVGLEVEAFRCTWPGDFGSHMCSFETGIVLPGRSDRIIGVDGYAGPVKVDGVFRKA